MKPAPTLSRACAFLVAGMLVGCNGDDPPPPPPPSGWQLVHSELPGALLSVWGTSATDVWIVGGDAGDGSGPMLLHYDGAWERIDTGRTEGDLWWVFGFDGGPIYMGGSGGVILRYEGGDFTVMTTPTTDTVFGIWGASPDDMWAVGGTFDRNGFAWRLQGDTWTAEPSLPATIPAEAAVWKVFGRSADDAWLVGSNGVSFEWDGSALVPGDTGVGSSLFTVHANAQRYAAVGGFGTGVIVEDAGDGWEIALDAASAGLAGVCLGANDAGVAVGLYGTVYVRDANGWTEEETGIDIRDDLHGAWIDPGGGLWAVGGQTAAFPLVQGLLIHNGEPIAEGDI